HVDRLAAQALEHAVDRIAVGIVDLAFAEHGADRFQLVSRGEERDAEPAYHRHLADPERCDEPELRRANDPSAAKRDRSRFQVLARLAPVLPRPRSGRGPDALA